MDISIDFSGPMARDAPDVPGISFCTYRGERLPWASISSFLLADSAANERLQYQFDGTDPDEARRRLAEAGLDVDRMLAWGQLQFRAAEEHYLPDGVFDPRSQIESARRALTEATRDGFEGLRSVGEMGWTADRNLPDRTLVTNGASPR